MALTFQGLPIPGTHGWIRTTPPSLHVVRTKYAAIRGEAETMLEKGGRSLECDIWLHDASFATAQDVIDLLERFDGFVGAHGDLVVTGPNARTFTFCTFEGFEPTEAVLPVIGSGMDGQYFTRGVLRWYQLIQPLATPV